MNNFLVALAALVAAAALLGPARAAAEDGAIGTDRHEVPEFVLRRTELAAGASTEC